MIVLPEDPDIFRLANARRRRSMPPDKADNHGDIEKSVLTSYPSPRLGEAVGWCAVSQRANAAAQTFVSSAMPAIQAVRQAGLICSQGWRKPAAHAGMTSTGPDATPPLYWGCVATARRRPHSRPSVEIIGRQMPNARRRGHLLQQRLTGGKQAGLIGGLLRQLGRQESPGLTGLQP
jgi:hypothetical protein